MGTCSIMSICGRSTHPYIFVSRRYVEWEKYPVRKAKAAQILKRHKFTPIPGVFRSKASIHTHSPLVPEFQMGPLPTTNPILVGHRWKEYHEVLGLKGIVDFSWETVLKEKPDLIHLLDFPYNGETRRKDLMEDKITGNMKHL